MNYMSRFAQNVLLSPCRNQLKSMLHNFLFEFKYASINLLYLLLFCCNKLFILIVYIKKRN